MDVQSNICIVVGHDVFILLLANWCHVTLRSQSSIARRNRRSICLWRAVDQDGYVLDEIVLARRDTKAAKQLLVRLLKKQA